jgi:hypothetical protein
MDIHTAEPLVPEPSLVEVEIAIGKLKSYKSPGTDQIPTELIKAGGETLCSEIHRLICCIWNKEELLQQWKESITVSIHIKDDKTYCNNYRGISLLVTAYEILSKILLARLTPYVNEIIGDHQCGFRRNRSTTDQIFYIQQVLEKKIGLKIIRMLKCYNGIRFLYSHHFICANTAGTAQTVWAMGWTIGVLGFDSRRGLEIFLFIIASRMALGPTQPPIQRVLGALSLGVRRPEA